MAALIEQSRGSATRWLSGVTLLGLPYIYLVHRFWFVTDDAFISFRYARNLAAGHGLR